MNNVTTFCAFVSVILICMSVLAFVSHRVIQDTFGINGTCGGGNLTKGMNQTLISNLISPDYIKNLTTDNPQLAELVKTC
ncbi:MAG: hypothetical protein M3O68_08795 [Thermoproteota archaeon]|nr:hypothetical protein [Thermoproteota archaeon]